jgi:enterochelin esterase-like enzyme
MHSINNLEKLFYPFLLIVLIGCNPIKNEKPAVSSGRIDRIDNLVSKYVDTRIVDVWLPDNYSAEKKYAVIYMHDGQMLFDSTITWNKQEWRVDEELSLLIDDDNVRECIVVGIWNNGAFRHSEYFPQRILEDLSEEIRNELVINALKGKAQADNYLRYLVDELKPLIDTKYSTYSNAENTIIMGSSMGGIISLYALCEYPQVFGAAACLSTHWPLVIPGDVETSKIVSEMYRNYLKAKLPLPNGKRVYFDYGTGTLDSLYKPHQLLVDEILRAKGYSEKNWITIEFKGDEHSERSWSRRLSIPLKFVLNK